MRVFKFYCGEYYYVYAAKSIQNAVGQFRVDHGLIIIYRVEEIPESKWDERNISIWEDGDFEKEPLMASIRELMPEYGAQFICSNDQTTWE